MKEDGKERLYIEADATVEETISVDIDIKMSRAAEAFGNFAQKCLGKHPLSGLIEDLTPGDDPYHHDFDVQIVIRDMKLYNWLPLPEITATVQLPCEIPP